jgi:hypothetical protein
MCRVILYVAREELKVYTLSWSGLHATSMVKCNGEDHGQEEKYQVNQKLPELRL